MERGGHYLKISDHICDWCGDRSSSHVEWRHWEEPQEKFYCCSCYVLYMDGAPADWHPGCMETVLREKLAPNPLDIFTEVQ